MKLQVKFTPWIRDIKEAKTFRVPKNIVLQILIYLGVFLLLQMAESAVMMPFLMPRLFDWAMNEINQNNGGSIAYDVMMDKINNMMMDPANTTIMLFCTLAGTIVIFLYCRFVEGRKLRTIGMRKEHALPHYLLGLLGGFAAFSMVVGIACLTGGLHFEGYRGQFGWGLLAVFCGFLLQGMSEEVTCRGFMMSSTLRHHNMWWAIGINSVLFALMHAFNTGFSLLACINLILCGVMFSLYALRTGSLWGACAFHSIWNFAQGNFYGLPVSGIDSGDTIFSMSLTGSDLVNGGAFGLEGSIATTIVLLIWIAALLFVPNPFAKKQAAPETETAA